MKGHLASVCMKKAPGSTQIKLKRLINSNTLYRINSVSTKLVKMTDLYLEMEVDAGTSLSISVRKF